MNRLLTFWGNKMSLTDELIKEQVSNFYPDMQQVSNSVICFTKKYKNEPYAIYYVDLTRKLPASIEDYQDEIIGKYYFNGKKSLQWNNYLYFIVDINLFSKKELLETKKCIETDRTYARKFVIDEEKLDSLLVPTKLSQNKSLPHESILSTWTNLLTEAGITKAIFSKNNMPSRLKIIEKASSKEGEKNEASRFNPIFEGTSYIKSLKINEYRKYPLNKHFNFGKVNLIVGPNGSGKTSLLESIELFYCGKNKRNLKPLINYDINVVFEDGIEERVTNNRDLAQLRNRNLAWYGQSEINTWNIYQSFARYNFLDTDAAMSLAQSTSNLEEDLSKLLVGPEAADVWRTIERVHETLSSELKDLEDLKSEINEEITTFEKQIKVTSSMQYESDLIHARLKKMIIQFNWQLFNTEKEPIANQLVQDLPEIIGLIRELLSFKWANTSINELDNYCIETADIIKKVDECFNQHSSFEKDKIKYLKVLDDSREILTLLNKAENLVKANLPILIDRKQKEQDYILKCNNMLVGLDNSVFDLTKHLDPHLSVMKCCHITISKRNNAESIYKKYEHEYNLFREKQDRFLNLKQELRQVAEKILRESTHPDTCPLCHTQFESGELFNQIKSGIDEQLEITGQTMLSQIRKQKEFVDEALALESAVIWLKEYCTKANLNNDITLNAALSELKSNQIKFNTSQNELKIIHQKLSLLESQNISHESMDKIRTLLSNLNYPLIEFSEKEIKHYHKIIQEKIASSSKIIDSNGNYMREIEVTIAEILNLNESDIQTLRYEFIKIKEHFYSTEPLQKRLRDISNFYPLLDNNPLDELFSELQSIRQMAVELQNAINKEKQADSILQTSLDRKAKLEPKLANLLKKEEKYREAFSILNNIKKRHSLEKAMKSVLHENRANIEKIFSNIHSPAEFDGIGESWKSLIRKNGEEASLSQISTGQRAAFALSIFLAQNVQLKNAPPVILIDDPIAHIDDLNSLSFLDYLRDLALNNDRQIFFATANEKLAALFERKFDFMNDDFCKLKLKRPVYID
jgi:DNA repair exonuclease SbcCD ATPase subunit